MFLRDDLRDILGYFLNSMHSIYLRFLVYLLKMSNELLFNVLMLFQPFPLWILNISDVVMHSSFDSCAMEELCVSFALFKPSDS